MGDLKSVWVGGMHWNPQPDDLVGIANLGLTLSEAKRLLASVQRGPG